MSWFTPKELPDNKYYIFGQGGGNKLSEMAKAPLLGQIPLVQGIREASDMGKPILAQEPGDTATAFMEVARKTRLAVDRRNENRAPTRKVDIKI